MSEQPDWVRKNTEPPPPPEPKPSRQGWSNENPIKPGSARETELRAKNRGQALRGAIDFYTAVGSPVNPDRVLRTADVFLAWLERP